MKIRLTKNYIFITILVLVLLHTFSFGPVTGMEINKHGQMSACPFTMASSICAMGFSEHLNLWQSMFVATVNNNVNLLVLALVGMIISALSLTLKYLAIDLNRQIVAYQFYARQHSKNCTFNKLLELFSRGILNPKVYELVAL